MTLHRVQDPAFAQAMVDAIVVARERLTADGGIAPPSGWGWLNGEELVVRGTNGRRVQVARAARDEFSPRVEARFLGVLAGTCNVQAACAEIGMSATAVYAHRKRRQAFAELWDRAVETGYARLEAGLVERAGSLFSGETVEPELDLGAPTFAQALQLLFLHKHRVHKLGKPMRCGAGIECDSAGEKKGRRGGAAPSVVPGESELARTPSAARLVLA